MAALESLSLAHNLLSSDKICSFDFRSLKQLTKLDLGRNVLNSIPENICSDLMRYVEDKGAVLNLVNVNMQKLP